MGSFGIEFSDSFSRKRTTEEIQDSMQKSTDGLFQKSLAYSSYYVMLFVAYVMITPDKMQLATHAIESLFV